MKKEKLLIRTAILWKDSIVSEKTHNIENKITVGDSRKSTVILPNSKTFKEKFELFSGNIDNNVVLNINNKMSGWIKIKEDTKNITDIRQQKILLNLNDKGSIKINEELSFFFQVISHKPKNITPPFLSKTKPSFLTSFLFALSVHFFVLVFAFANQNFMLSLYEVNIEDRFMEIITEKINKDDLQEEDKIDDVDSGKKAVNEEGKFGKKDKIIKSKVPTTEGEMVDKIKNIGLAKALNSSLMGRGALSSVFGNKNGFADQLNAAMSGGDGELVMGHGAGGMGFRGTGVGGGGSGFGRIHGMGSIDTGGGRGTRARLNRKRRKGKKFKISRGKPSLGNFCKQADILRVVSARQRAITYCYEKELARNPELGGKVTMKWRIGLDGKVMKTWVASSNLKNGTVESCIKRSIQRWRFTKPEGGICVISFPFIFNSGL
tara:strand:+ start:207 stop:1508 length:1302 start_codon:yes stop_codon:yes gene_type:complete